MSENPLSADDLLELDIGVESSNAAGGSSQSSRARKRKQKKAANISQSKQSSGSLSSIESVIDGVIEDGKESVVSPSAQQGIKKNDKGAIVRNAESSQRTKKARHLSPDGTVSSQSGRPHEESTNAARTPSVHAPLLTSMPGDDYSDFVDNFVSDSIFSSPRTAMGSNSDDLLIGIPLFDINNSRLPSTSTRVGPNFPVYGNLVYNVFPTVPPTTAITSSGMLLYGTHVPSVNAIGQRAPDTLIDFDIPLSFQPVLDYNNNAFDAANTHMDWDMPLFHNIIDGVIATEDPQLTINLTPNAIQPVSFPQVLNPTTPPAVVSAPHLNIGPSTAAELADLQFSTPLQQGPPSSEDKLSALIAEASSVQPLSLDIYIGSLLLEVLKVTGTQGNYINPYPDFQMQQLFDGIWVIQCESLPVLSKLAPLYASRTQKTSSRLVNTLVKIVPVSKLENKSRKTTKRDGKKKAHSATEAVSSSPPSALPPAVPLSSLPSGQQAPPIRIDSKDFFKTIMDGEYLEPLLYGSMDYQGYCLGDNPFPDRDKKIDTVFYRERNKVLEIGKRAYDHFNLHSLKHMIFFVLLQNAISLILYREKLFARGDVKRFSHERLVDVLNFHTPDPEEVPRQILMNHHMDVKAIAQLLLVKNRLFETRYHKNGYPGAFTNSLFKYLMDKLLFSGTKIIGSLICNRSGQSIPLVTYALIASALKLNLLPYRKYGHSFKRGFTLKKWQSEYDKQLVAVEEADVDTNYGTTFKEIRQTWAFVGVNSRYAKLRDRRVFLGPEFKYDDSDECSDSDSNKPYSDTESDHEYTNSDGLSDSDGSDDSYSGSNSLIHGAMAKYEFLSRLDN